MLFFPPCHHSILCLSFFHSLPLVYLWLLAAANLCSDCQKNESVLSAWKIIFFARPPLTCYHVKVEKRGKKTVCVWGWGRNGVSLRERIRARPITRSQEVQWESGPDGTHPCSVSHCLGFFFFLPLFFLFFSCLFISSYTLHLRFFSSSLPLCVRSPRLTYGPLVNL